jgi:hypothetical protein
MDSLAMFFGAKRKRRTVRRKSVKNAKFVIVKGRKRKLHKGKKGALYYRTKSGRKYVNAAFIRKHQKKAKGRKALKRKVSKRRRASPKRRRASPKRRRASPKRRRASPKRRRASPKRRMRRTRYGYGLGQPSLIDMMGPAGLSMIPAPRQHLLGPGGLAPN